MIGTVSHKSYLVRAWLIIATAALAASLPSATPRPPRTGSKDVHPIAVRLYDDFVIVGGTVDGRWVPAKRMEKRIPAAVDYRLCSVVKQVGSGVGRRWTTSELQDYTPLPVIRIKPSTGSQKNASLAISGDWNVLPRKVQE